MIFWRLSGCGYALAMVAGCVSRRHDATRTKAEIDVELALDETSEARAEPISNDGGKSRLDDEIRQAIAPAVGNMWCIGQHIGVPVLWQGMLHDGEVVRIMPQSRRRNRSLIRHDKGDFAVCPPCPLFVG